MKNLTTEEKQILNKSDITEIQKYAQTVKSQLIQTLKDNRLDGMREAIETKLREEMVICAADYFANHIKKDLLIKTLLGIVVMFGLSFISFIFESLLIYVLGN